MERTPVFQDRVDAGRALAASLARYARPRADRQGVVVLGLPRGGIPVAYEVARALRATLDAFIVRKLGVPGHEETAMGAIASGNVLVLNHELIRDLDIRDRVIEMVIERERRELKRREQLYRDGRPPPDVRGLTTILVDDGLATGASMQAAIQALRQLEPAHIVAAVPVAAASVCQRLAREVDEVVCAATPEPFHAVGLWYEDFSETSDDEVRDLLRRSEQRSAAGGHQE
jgi:predicted phosphoribosyltransferase